MTFELISNYNSGDQLKVKMTYTNNKCKCGENIWEYVYDYGARGKICVYCNCIHFVGGNELKSYIHSLSPVYRLELLKAEYGFNDDIKRIKIASLLLGNKDA